MRLRLSIGTALAFVVCVCCTFAFGITRAMADIDSGLGGNNAITATVGDEGPDISGATITIYKVASVVQDQATGSYGYSFTEAFKSLGDIYAAGSATGDVWQKMTDEARTIISDPDVQSEKAVPANGTITGIPDGMYLLNVSDVATGTDTYHFTPALVVVPVEIDAEGNPVPVSVVVKSEISGRYGSLQINKTVTDFSGEAATFVYHIFDTETQGQKYDNYAAVQYTAQGVQSTTVSHIPAGMQLTITEEYTGARYQLASEQSRTTTIVADDVVGVAFVNAPSNTGIQGHGIENHFVFDEKTNGGDWVLTPIVVDASEIVTQNSNAA